MNHKPLALVFATIGFSLGLGATGFAQTQPNTSPAPNTTAPTSNTMPNIQMMPMTAQQSCAFGLHELTKHHPGVDAIVSPDGSSIVITENPEHPAAPGTHIRLAPKNVRVYGPAGVTVVTGISCSFDRVHHLGDGVAEIFKTAANRPMPQPGFPGDGSRRPLPPPGGPGADHMRPHHSIGETFEACAKVYPQVEALRNTPALKTLLAAAPEAPPQPPQASVISR